MAWSDQDAARRREGQQSRQPAAVLRVGELRGNLASRANAAPVGVGCRTMPEVVYLKVIPYILYGSLNDQQRADFKRKGESLGVFFGAPPSDWRCRACGAYYALNGQGSVGLGVTEGDLLPICHEHGGCVAYGWDRVQPHQVPQHL